MPSKESKHRTELLNYLKNGKCATYMEDLSSEGAFAVTIFTPNGYTTSWTSVGNRIEIFRRVPKPE